MGFITTDRPSPSSKKKVSSKTWDGFGYTSVADCLRFYDPRQVTTSYRTGRPYGVSSSDSLEDVVDASGSYQDMFHALKQDLRDSPPLGSDTGHEFNTLDQRVTLSHSNEHLEGIDGGRKWRYDGPISPDVGHLVPALYTGSLFGGAPDVNQSVYGPTAIKLTAPTNPIEALAVGLAELKSEGFPPSVNLDHWKSRTASARHAGEAHLEVQFGWLPLMSDIQKTFYAIKHASQLLDQLQRDSGGTIRRRMTFPTTVSEQFNTLSPSHPIWVENVAPSALASMMVGRATAGILTESIRSQNTVSFSGAFTYYLQRDNSTLNKLKGYEQKINHLLGTRVTPETLWNLAPWSWLSDWKINIGDNISNAVRLSEDGLVLRYGYLMSETITDHTLSLSGPVSTTGVSGPYSITFSTIRKERVRATPYGFAINPTSFNVRQWGILGALGLTKAPEKLW